MDSLKKPSTNNLNSIKDRIEDITGKKCIRIESQGPLASFIFLPISRMPVKITELREELADSGYIFFYSTILESKGKQELLSFNISKLIQK
jgi:hypothetical protein